MRVSKVNILINLLLTLLKFIAGIVGSSGAMICDAIHSASDVFSTVVVMIGVRFSTKDSDVEHPYGHEKMEYIAAIVLAVILMITALGIGTSGFDKVISRNNHEMTIPGVLALFAAVVSIIIKEIMFWYTKSNAKRIDSGALMADAWHHRSDALSSVGAFIGIFGARLGYPVLDPVASMVICVFIAKAAYDIFRDAVDRVVDKSCNKEMEEMLTKMALKQDGVIGVQSLKTRIFGNKIYVDLEIIADGNRPLKETHAIAHKVHDEIEREFIIVKHIMVHVNPE